MRAPGLIGAAILAAVVASSPALAQTAPKADSLWVRVVVSQTQTPTVRLSATAGSYVTVLRVSDDKKVHVVFPVSPDAQRPVPEGPGAFSIPLDVPRYSMGGIYAVVSSEPFNYSGISHGNSWNSDALILSTASDPEHAANRVFGMITPLNARVASSETVYLGSSTAQGTPGLINLVSLYMPSQLEANAGRDTCSIYAQLGNCLGPLGSPYVGCLEVGANTVAVTPRVVCGSVSDVFLEMRRSLPPRELAKPVPPPSLQPTIVQPAPAPTTPASPTPLPAATNTPPNPSSIPPR